MLVSIVTPVYNRAHLLIRVWKSLLSQHCKNFEWIIVDDGSTDNIDDNVRLFVSNDFVVSYYKKENGGKHTALNLGITKAKGDYILILDSDDFLLDNAVELIISEWEKFKCNSDIAAIVFLKCDYNYNIIGDKFVATGVPYNNIRMRYKNHISGDKCEVFRAKLLKDNPFPVFKSEKFLSECIIWNKLSESYDMIYVNQAIYACEYLGDGLSQNVRKLFYNNPKGVAAMENGKTIKMFPFYTRLISTLQYIAYSYLCGNNIKQSYIGCRNKKMYLMLWPFGKLLFIYKKLRISYGI